jgi:hypothetical protein
MKNYYRNRNARAVAAVSSRTSYSTHGSLENRPPISTIPYL